MDTKIEITGIGCISPWGDMPKTFIENIKTGTAHLNLLKDFELKKYVSKKGLRTLPKSTKMAIAATKLAIEDSGYSLDENWDEERIGVFVGNSMSYLNNINDFLKSVYVDGPESVSPLKFPNTVLNNISGWVSIVFNIKGINSTVNTGNTSGIDAIIQAKSYIENGIIDKAIVVAVEDIEQAVLHNEAPSLENTDYKMTEMAVSIVLEKSSKNNKYGTIKDTLSWIEHTYKEGIINQKVSQIIESTTSINKIIYGSGNKNDLNIQNFIEKENLSIKVENPFTYVGTTYAVSGMIKLLIGIFSQGQSLIVETNEYGNNCCLLVEN
ncbi:beta-ketoacyl synthase N-terminal-like domain-containing protein [Lysinibacillus sp. NPDC059133]|uniref:beta-ketoacyl synthase N-terminal-like domain-containing protein n=1 Tax=Lysinibacillus sp. NPDC059133 TaxID=3346737 RepID=UPI003689FE69